MLILFLGLQYYAILENLRNVYTHISEIAGIEDNKEKNIGMTKTESRVEMEKLTANDTLTEENSEMTIQPLYKTMVADRNHILKEQLKLTAI